MPDLLHDGNPLPASPSQEKKVTRAVRARLPGWIEEAVRPVIEAALAKSGLHAALSLAGRNNDKLILAYPPVKTGTGYAAATIQLEFGARSTGEPHRTHRVPCDIAPLIEGVEFPSAQPLVMAAERTFWEKATAAHVFCLQGRLHGERYSRHWYDLAAMAMTRHFDNTAGNRQLARQVAEHEALFFAEKDAAGNKIDYFQAVSGSLQLIPEGESLAALETDYAAMRDDGLLARHQPAFPALLESCRAIQDRVNRTAQTAPEGQ